MKSAVKIVLVYIFIALSWIILSDTILSYLVHEYEYLARFSLVKGIFYVFATGLILFLLIRKEMLRKSQLILQLEKTLRLRDELVREVHHRVKNNLQNIISIIHLETEQYGYTEHTRERILNKLFSMSAVHDVVYRMEEFRNISLLHVIQNFFSYLHVYYEDETLNIAPGVEYPVEEMVSIMLCLNELFQKVTDAGLPFVVKISAADSSCIDVLLEFPEPGAFSCKPDDISLFLERKSGEISCQEVQNGIKYSIHIFKQQIV